MVAGERRLAASAAALILSSACGGPAPTGSTASSGADPSFAATASATPVPAATLSASAEPTASGEVPAAFLVEIVDVPLEVTTPLLEATTDGDVVLWSSGAPDGPVGPAPDLWRLDPAEGAPERIFHNEYRDSSLLVLGGDGNGAYAFVELNERVYGPSSWRLWYLPPGVIQPLEIDRADVPGGLYPFFSLAPDRIVWAVLHETPDGVRSQLLSRPLPEGPTETLLEFDALETAVVYPDLDGESLVYSTITVETPNLRARGDVYVLELGARSPEPRQLNSEAEAFGAVRDGDWVIWQEQVYDNPLAGGMLMRHSLATGITEPIDLFDGKPANFHDLGNRFVAAEGPVVTKLVLVDLATDLQVRFVDYGPALEGQRRVVVRPRLEGDMLVFVEGSDDPRNIDLVVHWARLPAADPTD